MRGGVTCILAVTAKSIHSSRSIFSSPHWEEVNILRLTLRCKNLLENVVEALQKVFVGSMAPVTVFAHIVSGGSVLLLIIFLLVVKVIVKYGGGFQQVPQLLHLAVDWACGTAHSSATSRGRESSLWVCTRGSHKTTFSGQISMVFGSQSMALHKFLARLILFGPTAHLQQPFHNSFLHKCLLHATKHWITWKTWKNDGLGKTSWYLWVWRNTCLLSVVAFGHVTQVGWLLLLLLSCTYAKARFRNIRRSSKQFIRSKFWSSLQLYFLCQLEVSWYLLKDNSEEKYFLGDTRLIFRQHHTRESNLSNAMS